MPLSPSFILLSTLLILAGGDGSEESLNLRKRQLTLNSITPEMEVLASVGDQVDLHTLFLTLDYNESNNTIMELSDLQQKVNPNGNLVVKAEGVGPLYPLLRTGSIFDFASVLFSRFTRPIWQGKFLEFPDPDRTGRAKFINQYVGMQGWTGEVYPGTIQTAAKELANQTKYNTIVPLPSSSSATIDKKPSLILDYREGDNWNTNVMDECRPLSEEKLIAANIDLSRQATDSAEKWPYLWLCRGTAPRFLMLGGERVFILFFLLQVMPETISYNVTI